MSFAWVAVGTAVAGAASSYAGSKKQADAAKKAGQMNMDMFGTVNAQQQPFIQGGYGAMGRLNTLLGLNPRPRAALPAPGMQPGGNDIWSQLVARGLANQQGTGVGQGQPTSRPMPFPIMGGSRLSALNRIQ